MWCSHCHQEVPAVASATGKLATCSRCQRELKFTQSSGVLDSGIELSTAVCPSHDETARRDPLADEEAKLKLHRLGQKLHTPYARPISLEGPHFWERLSVEAPSSFSPFPAITRREAHALRSDRNASNWYLNFLLTIGVFGFFGGAASLVWSAAFNRTYAWQWGLTITIAAEGLLIVGLTWMAARLWRNSRRLNRQLSEVDDQLDEIHELAGTLSAGRQSASQHYYQHFSQVANPHMLVANLRGQIDQLAERMAG
jgi:hypothetical protein